MIKKVIILFISAAFLAFAYWLISPLFRDEIVNESLNDIGIKTEENSSSKKINEEPRFLLAGKFEGLANHAAEGTATIVKVDEKYFLRFDDDFKSTNGPDVFVHLGKDGKYDPRAVLGPIKGNIGGQNYEIPATLDISQYDEVWLWCRAFSVPFGKASLESAAKSM